MTNISQPQIGEYAPTHAAYINPLAEQNLDPIQTLKTDGNELIQIYQALKNDQQLQFAYAQNKWTLKQLLIHLIDAERIFNYRMLRMARKDTTPLSGFDENQYINQNNFDHLTLQNILDEFVAVRQSTLAMIANLTPDCLQNTTNVNQNRVSLRAMIFIASGHQRHHLQIIKQRYLIHL